MSRQREFQQRLALYHELQDIMGAMKNMAQAEIHKLRRRQQQQQACLNAVTDATHAAHRQLHHNEHTRNAPDQVKDIWLLIGSERGFCGGFNEALIRHIATLPRPAMNDVIIMGSRLLSLLGNDAESAEFLPGPASEKQVSASITAALECFQRLQQEHRTPLRLTAVCHDLQEIHQIVLFPFPETKVSNPRRTSTFRHQEPLPALMQNLENHYLYHALLAVLYTSLYAENHRRLMQMEGALQHLDELSQQMKVRINAQRQEEIVEEIEVIFSSTPRYE